MPEAKSEETEKTVGASPPEDTPASSVEADGAAVISDPSAASVGETAAAESRDEPLVEVSQSEATVHPQHKKQALKTAGIVAGVSFVLLGVATNLDIAGRACYDDGSVTTAIYCFQLMTGITSVLGLDDMRLSNAWTDLGICYSKELRWHEAIKAQEQAVALRKKLQGFDHPNVLALQANVAMYMTKEGEAKKAEPLLNDLLKRAESHQPQEMYSMGFILGTLTDTLIAEKKYSEAEQAAQKLISIDNQIMPRFLRSFEGRDRLATLYVEQGRLAEAEAQARDSLAFKQQFLGPQDNSIAYAHETIGKVLLVQNKKEAARQQFDEALEILRQKYGKNDPKVQYWTARFDHLMQLKDPFHDQVN